MKRNGRNCDSHRSSKITKRQSGNFNGYEHKDIVRDDRNCNPLKLDEVPIEERLDWLNLEHEEKRLLLKSQRVQVIRHNEMRLVHEENTRMFQYLKSDPELKLCPIKPNESQDVRRKRYQLIGKRIYNRCADEKKSGEETDEIPEEFEDYKKKTRYDAPAKRIRITENLSQDPDFMVPVYCDIKGETVDNCKVPDSLLFDYIDRNVVDIATQEDLANAVEMSKQEQNMIKCSCKSYDEPICLCYQNPNCKCYQMNLHLQKLQKVKRGEEAEFQSFNPIMFHNGLDTFFNNIGFSCSEICACSGKCTNNVFFHIEKKQFSFEVFRKNAKLGFELRSPMLIPAGTPILEFTGKIIRNAQLEIDIMDYAMTLTYPGEDRRILQNILKSNTQMTPEFQKALKKLFGVRYHVDCKYQGNISRFLCHSCVPNLELVRIYQKSFTPAHIRLALVALDDIFPRTPMTIDYGKRYYLPRCECGTFACKSEPHFSKFSKMSLEATMQCCHDQWHFDYNEHKNEREAIRLFYNKEPIPKHHTDKLKDVKPILRLL